MPTSEARKISYKKYRQSEKGKELQRKMHKKYAQSDKGKITSKRYNKSEKGRARTKKYRQSEKGMAVINRCKQSIEYKNNRKLYHKSEKAKELRKQYDKTENGKIIQRRQVLSRYSLSILDFNNLLDQQNGCCKICDERFSDNVQIDHDHKTGKVRGLLCRKCNLLLGFCNDTIKILASAIRYLESNEDVK